jgi:TonB-dependent starch-binding outer membrane protein SusC
MKRFYNAFLVALFISFTSVSLAQTVSGKVLDENKLPTPGVVVKDVKTGAGVITDINGTYSLKLTPGAHKIEISFIGYQTVTKDVTLTDGQTTTLDISIAPDDALTDEVVVVGYGVQRKREVTGSIAKIDGKELTKLPVPSFEAALQGQAAGVQVTQGSGLAGSASLIKIRGVASISAGGDPLYVIDGIPMTQGNFLNGNRGGMNNNPLATINPNDIESIEVLKDAAATGIYGSRGANGVVLITTKRGKTKGLKVDFSTRLGISQAASLPNMMNTDQYLAMRQEAWENDGGTGYVWLPELSKVTDSASDREAAFKKAKLTNTDWVGETVGIGIKEMVSVGISYGFKKSNLYSGLSYDNNGSYLKGNRYKRMSARLNFDSQLAKNLKMMSSMVYSVGENHRIDAAWSGGLGLAMSTALPYYSIRNKEDVYIDGNLAYPKDSYFLWSGNSTNPVASRELKNWRTNEKRLIGTVGFLFTPVKNLNIKLSGGLDYMDFADYYYTPANFNHTTPLGTSEIRPSWSTNWNTSITADYSWSKNDKHNFTILAGAETQRQETQRYDVLKYNAATAPGYQSDFYPTNGDIDTTFLSPIISTFVSSFFRLNYNFKQKYFVQAVARLDGSSKFGANNKYGTFPSISAGWLISEEKFLSESKIISFLKLRAGWGKSGNSDIPADAQYGTFTGPGGTTYNGNQIIYPNKLSNPNLRWETTQTYDLALEGGLWNDRMTFTISAYAKRTKDALMEVNLPNSTGFEKYWDNAAEIINRGLELEITSYNVVKKDFEWSTKFNISKNYNELVDIGNYTPDAVFGGTNDSRVIVGKPIGSFYLMKFDHIDSDSGLPVYLDKNGNQTFDYNNNQRQYVGNGLPDVIGGMTNTLRYKNFDLQFLLTYSVGSKIFDSSGKRQMGVVTDWNMRTDAFDRWRAPGDDATLPRKTLDETKYGLDAGFPWWNTDLFVYKANYMRLRNISIGYNVKMKEKSKVQNLKIAFNISNLFVITNYPGLDPELARDFEGPQDRNLSPNVTYLTPPQERSYNISINANF